MVALQPLIATLWLRMLLMSAVYLLLGSLLCAVFIVQLRRIAFGAPVASEHARQTVTEIRAVFKHDGSDGHTT